MVRSRQLKIASGGHQRPRAPPCLARVAAEHVATPAARRAGRDRAGRTWVSTPTPCSRPQRDSRSVLGQRAPVIFRLPEQVAERNAFAFFHVLGGRLLGEVRHSSPELGWGPWTAVSPPLLLDPGSQALEPCGDRGGQLSAARREGRDHPRPSRSGRRYEPPSVRRDTCKSPHPARLDGPEDPLNPDIPCISHAPETNSDGLPRAAAGVGLPRMTRAQAEETTCC